MPGHKIWLGLVLSALDALVFCCPVYGKTEHCLLSLQIGTVFEETDSLSSRLAPRFIFVCFNGGQIFHTYLKTSIVSLTTRHAFSFAFFVRHLQILWPSHKPNAVPRIVSSPRAAYPASPFSEVLFAN